MSKFDNIINDLDTKGFAEIDNILNTDDYKQINSFINLKKNEFNSNNFSLSDKELSEEIFEVIPKKTDFVNLYNHILNYNNIKISNIDKHLHKVLGVRKGTDHKSKKIPMYHFDAYLITILIPILVPEINLKDKGELIIFPNIRNIHKSMFTNFVVKFFTQNIFFRYLINSSIFKILKKKIILNLNKEKIYIFYGYKTFHGVGKLGKNINRSTLLYHIYNPHNESFLNNLIIKRNIKKRQKEQNKNKL